MNAFPGSFPGPAAEVPTGGDELGGSGLPASEAPHVVGGANEPAFDAGWSAAGNEAVGAGAAHADWTPPHFYFDPLGYVCIEGIAHHAAGAAAPIFTLPAEPGGTASYRPPARVANEAGNIEVGPDGVVAFTGSTAAAGAVPLRLRYRAV